MSPYLVGQGGKFRILLNTLVYELLLFLLTFQHFLTEGLDFPPTFRILRILLSADSRYRYPHSAGPISVCSTSSTSQRQCLHRSHGSVPVLARDFPKQPWPNNTCVRWKQNSPCLCSTYALTEGINWQVQDPFTPCLHSLSHLSSMRLHASCHSCAVLTDDLYVSSL